MIRFLKLCAAVVGLGLGLVLPALAQAQTLPASAIALTVGNYLTIDGVTIAVSSADCSQGSVDTGCGNLYMVPNSGPSASVIIEAATGGIGSALEPILSESCGIYCTSQLYDLSVVLTATTVAGAAPLTGAYAAITGSMPSGSTTARVGGTETLAGVTGCSSGLAVSLASAAAASAGCSYAPSTSVAASKDFGISFGYVGVAGTYQLGSVTETFTAPEPASLVCLLSGIFAIGAVRRRRRQRI